MPRAQYIPNPLEYPHESLAMGVEKAGSHLAQGLAGAAVADYDVERQARVDAQNAYQFLMTVPQAQRSKMVKSFGRFLSPQALQYLDLEGIGGMDLGMADEQARQEGQAAWEKVLTYPKEVQSRVIAGLKRTLKPAALKYFDAASMQKETDIRVAETKTQTARDKMAPIIEMAAAMSPTLRYQFMDRLQSFLGPEEMDILNQAKASLSYVETTPDMEQEAQGVANAMLKLPKGERGKYWDVMKDLYGADVQGMLAGKVEGLSDISLTTPKIPQNVPERLKLPLQKTANEIQKLSEKMYAFETKLDLEGKPISEDRSSDPDWKWMQDRYDQLQKYYDSLMKMVPAQEAPDTGDLGAALVGQTLPPPPTMKAKNAFMSQDQFMVVLEKIRANPQIMGTSEFVKEDFTEEQLKYLATYLKALGIEIK